MDKPRHPDVIRTWKLPNPVRGVSPVKGKVQRWQLVRGVPQVSKPHRPLQAKKPPES
jgi:hypothetical protein